MEGVESIKLSEVVKLVPKPRYILGTTYTLSLAFFESAIFPQFNRERLKSCLIISDSLGYHSALIEAAALQSAAQDYLVVRAPHSGSFHPKVWLIIGDNEALLLTGSGNLTQSGFMTNAEFFDAVHIRPDTPPSAELVDDLRSFVTGLANMWPREDHQELLCIEMLTQIEQAVNGLAVAKEQKPKAVRFLHSFRGPLLDQLPVIPDAKEIYIAAPYFGASLRGLDLLTARYPTAKLHLYPAVHSGVGTDIPLPELKKVYRTARVSPLSVSGKKGALAHLKLYGVALANKTAILYCGSANCTHAAWQGPNVEAGLLRSVSFVDLARYFVSAKDELPSGRLEMDQSAESKDLLHCSAVDTGAGFNVFMSSNHRSRLPLSNVKIIVRAGSALATCDRSTLFENACRAYFPWSGFEGLVRRKAAICLEFEAQDSLGKFIRTACLVENRLLLSADPTHRSAWRGALALLDAEGAPELGDIAALFSLAGNMFDENLGILPEIKISDGHPPGKSEKEIESSAIAIWPPQPDTQELRKKIGSAAHGQLQWFQNILKTLLQGDVYSNMHISSERVVQLPDDEQDENERDNHKTEKQIIETDRAVKTAKRMWDQAFNEYSRIRTKLKSFCPTPANAPKIWPVFIFAFLSTMAIFKTVRRIAPNLSLGITAELLCDDFLRAMFIARRQPEDYCRPRGFRYPSDDKFPPLATDLQFTFKIQLEPDFAIVILAILIDQRLRDPLVHAAPSVRDQRMHFVTSSEFVASSEKREACRRIWRRYLLDPKRKAVDASFEKEFNDLFHLTSVGMAP